MIRFEDVEKTVEKYHPDADMDLLRRAYFFSAREHRNQVRKSGEPYLIHPISVAMILAEMEMDVVTVSTGFLHDIVEDTLTSSAQIEEYFGVDVARLVDGVTKISHLGQMSKEDAQAESLRKMVLAMGTDIRVIIVKLADRLHNMRTLQHLSPEKRKRIARETMDVYSPIAHRLGMGLMRNELEDLSFKYLEPEAHQRLQHDIEKRRSEIEAFLTATRARIAEVLTQAEIPFVEIQGRTKQLFSIYQKLIRQKVSLDHVYDLVALRVLLNTRNECYSAMGVIHAEWTSVDGRFRDWIARPRENGYQSLHTSVMSKDGQSFEVQLRTVEMHHQAETGVAGHWKYKQGGRWSASEDAYTEWLRRMLEWHKEMPDARDFLETLKGELVQTEVFTLTPKGRIVSLPRGATPVDFAYAIHTEVGNQCNGAKVNGRIVPLRYELKTNDVVEILTSSGHQPSRDWLNFVVTTRARNRLKHAVAEQQRTRAIEIGRKVFDKEAARFHIKPKQILDSDKLPGILAEMGLGRTDDMFAAFGYGKLLPRTVFIRFTPDDPPEEAEETRLHKMGAAVRRALGLGNDRIIIQGTDDVLAYRAGCCAPINGEEIIGYITRGKGVAVHARRCRNAINLMVNKDRLIEVGWDNPGKVASQNTYAVKLSAAVEDRQGMLAALTHVIAAIKTNICDAHTGDFRNGYRRIDLVVDITDMKHLNRVMAAIKGVEGVIDVERVLNETTSRKDDVADNEKRKKT